jgi:competence protein ComEA
MDPNAMPWRVLEDPVEAVSAGASTDRAGPASGWTVRPNTLVVGVIAIVLAVGAFGLAASSGSTGSVFTDGASAIPAGPSGASAAAGGPADAGQLVVEIVGAVDRPGVFRLPVDARVGDLVAAAGGYGPRVDTDRAGRELNLAAPLHDGDQIRVPSRDDTVSDGPATTGGGTGSGGSAAAGPVDLNRATAEELDTLPGIGPATAAKIIASRDEQPFAKVADLRSRKLVGEKTFAGLADLVTVR